VSSGVADYGATAFLSIMMGITEPPSVWWIALCTDQPGEGMDGDILAEIEPDPAANYGRVSVASGSAHWGLNGQYVANIDTLDFGIPTADWGQISHYGILDAATEGNLWAFGEFFNPQEADATFDILIPQGGIVLALYGLENSIAV
jgi:hypothetical protein